MKSLPLVLLCFCTLTSCSRAVIESIYDVNYQTTNRFAKNLAPMPGQLEKDSQALDKLMRNFSADVAAKWGKDSLYMAGKQEYVKYTDNYESRSRVNFNAGTIVVETVAEEDSKTHLKQAIISTLLTPDSPATVDLYSSAEVPVSGEPFLQGQVLDAEGQPISTEWRASQFADTLIAQKLQQTTIDGREVLYVDIPMVEDHAKKRQYQYAGLVREASKRYDINEDLIYAIIKTESSFNPYALSWANAYGLMQVVPDTAGRDVFDLMKNRDDKPSPKYLYKPANNIDMGTAYFYLLKNRYLKDVKDPLSLHYSMISAYNGGASNVLKTFDSNDEKAIAKLNRLEPDEVFWALTHKHPSKESRDYLQKVMKYQQEFHTLR